MQQNKNFINDPNLSLKAKGLLAVILSHNHMRVDIQDLLNQSKEKNNIYYAALAELKIAGYITLLRYLIKGSGFIQEKQSCNKLSQETNRIYMRKNF